MRETSSNYCNTHTHEPKRFRGGEKKVMKKSLSLLVAIAMVFSMFASVAFAAEPQTTLEKYEFLKEKGVFEGTDGDKPALEDAMTRAQFAKILTKLKGLSENAAAASIYNDLEGAGWAAGFIGAVTAAKIMDGTWDGIFQPSGHVTVEQLATTMVRTFGLTLVNDKVNGKTSDWAQSYVATALKAGLISEQSDYTVPALRGQLVDVTYAAYNLLNVPAELSISDAKAVGASKVEVTFNKAVEDASTIKLTLNRGGSKVSLKEKDGLTWSDSKKVAYFNTETRLTEGTYTVKVEAADGKEVKIGTNYKDFAVQNETIKSIKFKTTSDIIPQAEKVNIEFEALNQYDEVSTLPATRFNITSSNTGVGMNPSNSLQRITVDTLNAVKNNVLAKDSYYAITIITEDGSVQANKSFRIGDIQSIGKVELDEKLILTGDNERLNSGDHAYVKYEAKDQYGLPVSELNTLQNGATTIQVSNGVISEFKFVADETGDNIPDLKVTTNKELAMDSEATLTVIANATGASSSIKIKVAAPKAPYEASFGDFNGTIAVGDTEKYLPLIVKDQYGATLSPEDVKTAYNNRDIQVWSSNHSVAVVEIETKGADKGKVKVMPSGLKGTVTITVMIPKTQKQVTYTVSIQEKRYPNSVYVSSANKDYLLPGSETSLKLKFKDQYGEDIKDFTDYQVKTNFEKISGNGLVSSTGNAKSLYEGTQAINDNIRDKNVTFTAANQTDNEATYKFTVELLKKHTTGNNAGKTTVVDTKTVQIGALKAEKANDLSYEVKKFENGIYAAKKGLDQGTVTQATYGKYMSKVEVSGKDSAGKTVALPKDAVKMVTVSNSDIAKVVQDGTDYKVYGQKAGNISVTVRFKPSTVGEQVVTLNDVKVSEEAPVAKSITAENNGKSKNLNVEQRAQLVNGSLEAFNDNVLGEIKVKDQYGVELKNQDLWNQSGSMGVILSFSNIKGSGSVTDNGNGTIKADSGINSFTVTIITANGLKQSADVYVKN